MKRLLILVLCAALMLSTFALVSCTSTENGNAQQASPAESAAAEPAAAEESQAAETNQSASDVGINIQPLVDDGSGVILAIGNSPGPNGEDPVGVEAILNLISDEKKEEIKSAGYTAAISLHTTASDWSALQLQGIQAVLDEFNIELLASTDAEMQVDKQVSDLESIMAMKPDMIISFVLDAEAIGPIMTEATTNGIKIALIDAVPAGFTSPKDYAGMGTADNYANGAASAQALVDYLGGKGQIAMLNYVSSLFHTDARSQGARDVFAQYPDIEIVAEQGVDGAEMAATTTESLLTAHPDIKAIWTVWDAPGMGAVGVIENMGKDVKVATVDLSEDTAYSIASGGAMLATGAQHPYDQGIAEAMIGVAALAGIETPAYVVVPGEIVTKESLKDSWGRVFKTPLPDDIAKLLG